MNNDHVFLKTFDPVEPADSSNLSARMHCTRRTSPFGEDYIGTCYLCGKTGIGDAEMFEECENFRGLTQGEALVEAIERAEPPP
jgi:hypothetical protein